MNNQNGGVGLLLPQTARHFEGGLSFGLRFGKVFTGKMINAIFIGHFNIVFNVKDVRLWILLPKFGYFFPRKRGFARALVSSNQNKLVHDVVLLDR